MADRGHEQLERTSGRGPRRVSGFSLLRAIAAFAFAVVSVGVVAVSAATEVHARDLVREFSQTLSPADRKQFEQWFAARTFFNAAVDAYWANVERVRQDRRARLRANQVITVNHYVQDLPPTYDGPALSEELSKRWQAFQAQARRPTRRDDELPGLDVFLAAAQTHFDFTPERIPEREFKRRYAEEAVRLGLSKEQVVRVYALETGGIGTADMIAGIHPIRGTGRPISSALGYAQLLGANTLLVLQEHGAAFEARLQQMQKAVSDPQRRAQLGDKITRLRRMRAYVNSLPKQWSELTKASRTSRGRGVHPINIDGDLGPWVQVIKLKDIKRFAERNGRSRLTPEQLELMNLAGPATGLEMMTALGSRMLTVNFFARRGYERNTIVRGRTARELLEVLGQRMDANEKNSGAVEFAQVFDEVLASRRAALR
ncbi:MAG: hypothetical protein ACFCUN_09150 [Hyphomicrobiaceae bacterium]